MRIEVNGARLFFDVEGLKLVSDGATMREKSTVILIHGAPGFTDHTSLKPQFSALADSAQLIYLDLSGAGRSDATPDEKYSLDRWADDLVAFCDALEIEKPVVLGVSGGGFVAAAYGIRHPEHPGKLVLASTQAKRDPQRAAAVFERLGGVEARDAALAMFTRRVAAESLAAYMQHCMPLYNRVPQDLPFAHSIVREALAVAFHDLGGIWHTMDLLDSLHRIQCPTLVLAGEDDPITPIQDSEDIVARLDPALVRFERFPGCGHGVWLDDPERAFAVLREFLAQPGR
jgi:proline iminopeptidase